MLDQPAMRRRSRAAWVALLALTAGVGLIAMLAGVSRPEHAHGSVHLDELEAGDDATHAPACDGCTSHASMTMVCAVLLVAVARGVAVRVARRLILRARLVHLGPLAALGWLRAATSALARAPDLHELQVMRC